MRKPLNAITRAHSRGLLIYYAWQALPDAIRDAVPRSGSPTPPALTLGTECAAHSGLACSAVTHPGVASAPPARGALFGEPRRPPSAQSTSACTRGPAGAQASLTGPSCASPSGLITSRCLLPRKSFSLLSSWEMRTRALLKSRLVLGNVVQCYVLCAPSQGSLCHVLGASYRRKAPGSPGVEPDRTCAVQAGLARACADGLGRGRG